MEPRLQLQTLLEEALGSDRVYFQPPPNIQLEYPCIIYSRQRSNTTHADNSLYFHNMGYTVTVIDANPDSPILDKIARLPKSEFDRHFTVDHLNHDVFVVYN